MSFFSTIEKYRGFDFAGFNASLTPEKISAILSRDRLSELDYIALLSDAAAPFLERMAQKAVAITRNRFGSVIFLFTPLYISNYCDNVCAYCSFARQQDIGRRHLSLDEIRVEAKRIAGKGIRHILVLTGESRRKAPPPYLEAAIRILRVRRAHDLSGNVRPGALRNVSPGRPQKRLPFQARCSGAGVRPGDPHRDRGRAARACRSGFRRFFRMPARGLSAAGVSCGRSVIGISAAAAAGCRFPAGIHG